MFGYRLSNQAASFSNSRVCPERIGGERVMGGG
jgi:hypothetical protein